MKTAPKLDELRPIPGTMDYHASADGRIWDSLRQRWLKLSNHSVGYLQCGLRQADGEPFKPMKVHRLVALAWLPNPEAKYSVNHLDGNKQNNAVSNLEWATMKENLGHASRAGLLGNRRPFSLQRLGLPEPPKPQRRPAPAPLPRYITPAGVFTTPGMAAVENQLLPRDIVARCTNPAMVKMGWRYEAPLALAA